MDAGIEGGTRTRGLLDEKALRFLVVEGVVVVKDVLTWKCRVRELVSNCVF